MHSNITIEQEHVKPKLYRDKSHKRLLLKHLEHIPVVFASSMLAVLHWLNSVSKTAVQTDSVFQNQ